MTRRYALTDAEMAIAEELADRLINLFPDHLLTPEAVADRKALQQRQAQDRGGENV